MFKIALLFQYLCKSRIGEQDSGDRRSQRDLKARPACMIPASLRAQVTACTKKFRRFNGPIYVSWVMTAKVCNFAMNTRGKRANLLHLFPLTLKLRGATLA